jgi:hypothetical protein
MLVVMSRLILAFRLREFSFVSGVIAGFKDPIETRKGPPPFTKRQYQIWRSLPQL